MLEISDVLSDFPRMVVDEVASRVEVQTLVSDECLNFVSEEWDRVSPINDVPAETILEKRDYPAGVPVLLIRRTGEDRVLVMQSTDHLAEGVVALTPERLPAVTESVVTSLAEGQVQQTLREFARFVESEFADASIPVTTDEAARRLVEVHGTEDEASAFEDLVNTLQGTSEVGE